MTDVHGPVPPGIITARHDDGVGRTGSGRSGVRSRSSLLVGLLAAVLVGAAAGPAALRPATSPVARPACSTAPS